MVKAKRSDQRRAVHCAIPPGQHRFWPETPRGTQRERLAALARERPIPRYRRRRLLCGLGMGRRLSTHAQAVSLCIAALPIRTHLRIPTA